MFWEGVWLALGAVKGLKPSRSAQSVWLARNNQLMECNCANPYVAVITREINGFLPFSADPSTACQRPPATRKDSARGESRSCSSGSQAGREAPGGLPSACLNNPFHLPASPRIQLPAPCLGPSLARTVRAQPVGARAAPSLPSPLSIHSPLPFPLFSPNCRRISRLFALFFCSFVILVATGNPASC